MITWEIAYRLRCERGLPIPLREEQEYEDKRLYALAHILDNHYRSIADLESEIIQKGKPQ
ncbi:MAG: hypothetical protein DWQ19_08870 [Crenarchaeota archaeon]|nr:MAG: hypothetical protein DWQ19_08870 [Thermoproteota archaeon]